MPNEPSEVLTASYQAASADVHRVLLLYSGGLDTSVMLKWIQEQYDAEIVTLTVNLGQPGEDYDVVRGKAMQLGAVDAYVVDAREEFAHEYLVPAIKANAIYGAGYPLFTSLGRPLIAKLAVDYARRSGCDTIAHGCTGKGNDQVRIEATVATLAPELKVIAPVRGWQMGRDDEVKYAREHGIPRDDEVKYAREHGIPVKGGTELAPYSIDDNIWGRSSEGRWIENLDMAPQDDVFQLVTRPQEAPDEPETVEVEFEHGVPVGLNGELLELLELLERAAALGAKHGVGIVDHIEDRIVGLKVRDIYEVPAATIILTRTRSSSASSARSTRTSSRPSSTRSGRTSSTPASGGSRLRVNLDAYMDSVNEFVTGTIGIQLYKGSARVVTRQSPYAVYNAEMATFSTSGGIFHQGAAPGFIELWTLQSRLAWRAHQPDADETFLGDAVVAALALAGAALLQQLL